MFHLFALEVLLVAITHSCSSSDPIDLVFKLIDSAESSSDEAPIIFLHGLTSVKEYWRDIPQNVANATKRKVYVIDSRNHGDSPWSDEFSFDLNSVDLIHFMDSHNIEKAILVGHSMGGITSIKTALRHPNRVEKFVTEDISVTPLNEVASGAVAGLLDLMKDALQNLPTDITSEIEAEKFVFRYLLDHFPKDKTEPLNETSWAKELDRDDYESNAVLTQSEDGRFVWKCNLNVLTEAMKNHSTMIGEFSGLFEGPALFIYGTASPFGVGKDEEAIHELIPRARFFPIEGATHEVHREFPKEFTEALIDFLLNEE